MNVAPEVEERIAAAAAALGFEVVETVVAGGSLRITIDSPAGVTVEDCAVVSRAVEPLRDEIPGLGTLALEVSSPGLDRKLRLPRDLRVGERVRVERATAFEGRRRYTGRLSAFDADSLTVEVEGAGAFVIPFREIASARLEPTW